MLDFSTYEMSGECRQARKQSVFTIERESPKFLVIDCDEMLVTDCGLKIQQTRESFGEHHGVSHRMLSPPKPTMMRRTCRTMPDWLEFCVPRVPTCANSHSLSLK
ncbi:hypothetical protein SAMN06265222_101892 [Neorhodopirellula lusitana]|uniref:FCP1 homology domain-containing protein n=1 Tax=Neorhodopirellula lusitana TaxID=445327 RepID=A0ABY1PQX7_9BACT|nr:hypothetical protein SAMN06265222_101892 [Neorhodopirellula lusitana]